MLGLKIGIVPRIRGATMTLVGRPVGWRDGQIWTASGFVQAKILETCFGNGKGSIGARAASA